MCIAEIKPKQVRLGEHTDFGTISLVFQLDSDGLQVGLLVKSHCIIILR